MFITINQWLVTTPDGAIIPHAPVSSENATCSHIPALFWWTGYHQGGTFMSDRLPPFPWAVGGMADQWRALVLASQDSRKRMKRESFLEARSGAELVASRGQLGSALLVTGGAAPIKEARLSIPRQAAGQWSVTTRQNGRHFGALMKAHLGRRRPHLVPQKRGYYLAP